MRSPRHSSEEQGRVVALQRKHEALAECIASMRLAASRGAGGATWSLRVRRGMIVSTVIEAFLAVDIDAFDAVRGAPRTSALLKRTRVSFEGEAGVDAGGLTAEMYQCFFEALVAPSGAGGGTRCPLFEYAAGDSVVAPAFLPASFAAGNGSGEFILFTVTFHANTAHDLTCPPSYIII